VVVPTLLTSAGVEELIEALEVRFLANRDRAPALRPVDRFSRRPAGIAGRRRMPLLELARTRIDELNEKYGADGPPATSSSSSIARGVESAGPRLDGLTSASAASWQT
jgi:cyclic beta-1,2-glucan synthetase